MGGAPTSPSRRASRVRAQDSTEFLSNHIVACFSWSPTGPFVNKTAVYTTPETGADASYGNGNVFMYNPHHLPAAIHRRHLLGARHRERGAHHPRRSLRAPRHVVMTRHVTDQTGS